jgi:hypothetical protein
MPIITVHGLDIPKIVLDKTFNIWLLLRGNYFAVQYDYFQTLQLSSSVPELQIFFSVF